MRGKRAQEFEVQGAAIGGTSRPVSGCAGRYWGGQGGPLVKKHDFFCDWTRNTPRHPLAHLAPDGIVLFSPAVRKAEVSFAADGGVVAGW